MKETTAWAVIIVAMASCTAAETYFESNMTPEQMCINAAWSASERLSCLKK